jgi:hypothetical protein
MKFLNIGMMILGYLINQLQLVEVASTRNNWIELCKVQLRMSFLKKLFHSNKLEFIKQILPQRHLKPCMSYDFEFGQCVKPHYPIEDIVVTFAIIVIVVGSG